MKGTGVRFGLAAVLAVAAGLFGPAVSRDDGSTPAANVCMAADMPATPAAGNSSTLETGNPSSILSDKAPEMIDLLPAQSPEQFVPPIAARPTLASVCQPLMLDDEGDLTPSPYTQPPPPVPGQGLNFGGVNNDLSLTYFNHYVYRGVDHSITASNGTANSERTKGTSLNLEIYDRLEFNLGNAPHPFFGIFANVYDADPKSRFQEIRPFYGANWNLKPLDFEGGGNSYLYPRREGRDTAEVYGKITLDDSFLINSDKPFLSPYIYAAYDYHRSNGWYFEAGVNHDVPLEDYGLDLNFQADGAYIMGYNQQFVYDDPNHDTGFQHYDVGVTATYSLTRLFSISPSFGQLDLKGYLFYTGKLNAALRANNVLWGGVGIEFKY